MRILNSSFKNFLILISFSASIIFSQPITKVLISGFGGQHDIDVQTAFEIGYSSYDGQNFSGTITRYYDTDIVNSLAYARNNGYQVLIRSTTGLSTAILFAGVYPDVQVFMPAGSNDYVLAYNGDIPSCPIIVTGAGITQNQTAYKVEFYGPDPISGGPQISSFSNGYIAGQIACIANKLNISIQEARLKARSTIPGDSGPDLFDGYGAVNTTDVINSALPVELTSYTATSHDSNVELNWVTATEVNNLGFEILRRTDKTDWINVAFVNGNGNSNSPKSYSYTDSPAGDIKFQYKLKQVDFDGKFKFYGPIEVALETLANFALLQNFPNPFNPSTVISYRLPVAGMVTLKVYDALGKEVATLVDEFKQAGIYYSAFSIQRSALGSGVYFYKLTAGNYSAIHKMIVMK